MQQFKPRALVTGGTGFIGSAVIRRLLKAGFRVRALVRPGSPHRSNLDGLEVEIWEGDLLDQKVLQAAMADCEAVFHLAADYRLWVRDPEAMYRVNVDASRWIVEAAVLQKVSRIVYCSSVAAIGHYSNGKLTDEDSPSSLEEMVGHYKRSKFLGEAAACEVAQRENAPMVVVNPTAPVGPRDLRPTPTGKMVLDTLLGKMPAYIDTGLNIVHVDDVAEGIWLAHEKGRVGERYILGGENIDLRDIFALLSSEVGCKAPRWRLSTGLLLPVAWTCEHMARINGKEPLSPSARGFAGCRCMVSSAGLLPKKQCLARTAHKGEL